mmetsp:Transcript_33221/g.49511  ORF Transcript_33221/g.49511 Transcript_33221/m.49511 type:complete len:115 (-) Transcript_33221:304-648(-)
MLHDSTVLFVSILVTSSSQTIIFVSFLLRDYSKKKLKISFSSQHHILYRKDTIFYPDACVFRRENYISRWIRALKLVSLSAFLFTLETLNAYMFYLWSPQKLKSATHKVVTKNI